MRRLIDLLFACRHARTSFPITPKPGGRTYVACTDCGAEIPYSWDEMRRNPRQLESDIQAQSDDTNCS